MERWLFKLLSILKTVVIFLVVFLTPDNEYMCSETDLTQEKGNFLDDHLQEANPSGWSFARGRFAWWSFATTKKAWNRHFWDLPQSNFNGKNGSKFSYLLTVSMTVKYSFFYAFPEVVIHFLFQVGNQKIMQFGWYVAKFWAKTQILVFIWSPLNSWQMLNFYGTWGKSSWIGIVLCPLCFSVVFR